MATLRTARLTLTPCSPKDCPDFVALEQDPEVMSYLNGGQPVDRAVANRDSAFLMPDGTEPHVWTARLGDGGFVGWFCLWPEGDGSAELGYRLQRTAWGKGLASEGAKALVDWGFAVAGYVRVTACTMVVNLASRRVMEKIGMTHARTAFPDFANPIPGAEHGEVWYQIARPPPLP
jgi:RimJ/RimL family protein N-acetyltransferase